MVGIAVDCGCSGNPGKAEYRGVDILTGEVLFEHKIGGLCTNNIAEFAALVAGVRYLMNQVEGKTLGWKVYSDSKTALAWYRSSKPKCTLVVNENTKEAWNLLVMSTGLIPFENKLQYVDFWDNKSWGETPADYGRK